MVGGAEGEELHLLACRLHFKVVLSRGRATTWRPPQAVHTDTEHMVATCDGQVELDKLHGSRQSIWSNKQDAKRNFGSE